MEVFVAITGKEDADLVEETLEAWELAHGCDPINVVQCRAWNYEVDRRVIADQMAHQDLYILADVGVVPSSRVELAGVSKRVTDADGLIGLRPETEYDELPLESRPRPTSPRGIRICRKGILDGWPEKMSFSYDDEHADAVRQAGKRVSIWQDTFFKRLPGPS